MLSVASGNIAESDWKIVRNYIRSNYSYRISPLTVIELLKRIALGDDEHFERNREGLRVMYGPHSNTEFLRFPCVFLLRRVLNGSQTKLRFEPPDLERWIKITLLARNKEALLSGKVTLPGNRNMTFGIALKKIVDPLQQGIDEHTQRLIDLRNGVLKISMSIEEWAFGILNLLKEDASPETCQKVAIQTDAAYRYDAALCNLAKNNNYDFSKW